MQFCPDQVNRLRIGQAPFFRGIQKRFPYIALAERNESLNPADKFQNQFCSDQIGGSHILSPAAPAILVPGAYAGFRRVVVDIPNRSQKIALVLNGFAHIAVLKQVAHTVIFCVEIIRITDGDLFHRPFQSAFRMNQQMHMVFHQAVGDERNGVLRQKAPKRFQIPLVVFGFLKKDLFPDSPGDNMVVSTAAGLTGHSWHVFHLTSTIAEEKKCVKRTVPLTRRPPDTSPDGIQARLEELQKELIKKANNKQDYDAIADEIFRLRDQKEQSELDSHHREEAMNRIKELQDFIAGQETDITEFDEALVRKLIEKITVFADHFTVEFKSGITIDIEA